MLVLNADLERNITSCQISYMKKTSTVQMTQDTFTKTKSTLILSAANVFNYSIQNEG